MAGCGKSSIGKHLAQKLSMPFLDTDDCLVANQGRPLQDIVDTEGPMGFRRIEEGVLNSLQVEGHVIATGGSSIYSYQGMENLRQNGIIVLLQAEVDILKKRIGNDAERGLVKAPEQSFEELYAERLPLYEKYADVTVECTQLDLEEVCRQILAELQQDKLR